MNKFQPFDDEEKELMKAIEEDRFQSVSEEEKEKILNTIRASLNTAARQDIQATSTKSIKQRQLLPDIAMSLFG